MKKSSLIVFFLFCSLALWAQGNFVSDKGLFTVNYLKGCELTEIEVSLTSGGGTPFLCFDADIQDIASNNSCLGDPAQVADDFKFTYTEPGIYHILFLRQLTNSQVYDSITIEIIEPSTPFVSLAVCNDDLVVDVDTQKESFDFYTIDYGDGSSPQTYTVHAFPFTYEYADPSQEYTLSVTAALDSTGYNNCSNTVYTKDFIPADQVEQEAIINGVEIMTDNTFRVDFELFDNQLYQLQVKKSKNGAYQSLASFSGTEASSYVIQDVDLNADYYCARIISVSQCSGDNLLSNEVCTIKFAATAGEGGNLLKWNYTDFQSTEVLKNGVVIYSGTSPFTDQYVLCGQSDEYQVRATDSSGIKIVSLPKELTAIAGKPSVPITQIATKVLSDSELELTWDVPQGIQPKGYLIYKKQHANAKWVAIDTVSANSYVANGSRYNSKISYYSVAYFNNCGGVSPIYTTASNILLKANQEENEVSLTWNLYKGFDSLLTEYVLVKYDDNMSLLDENQLGKDSLYTEDVAKSDKQFAFYQVEAYSASGLIAYSNLLTHKIPSSFFVPTGFTPNGDARNEELKVVGKFIEDVEFSVYNRWGTLIFRSNSADIGWDGSLSNRPAPEGTYTYTVRVKDRDGEEYYKSGVFNLIR